MLPELLLRHAGKFVTLHDGAVVTVADTEIQALTDAQAARPDVLVYVRRVASGPQPVERLPHLRSVEGR